MNPQHTVPLLDDNGIIIADSHAICAYLSDVYGTDDRLYPKCVVKRALVNSRLHFNSGHFFARMRFLYEPIVYFGSAEWPDDRIEYIQKTFDILERFLEDSPYVCGDDMTIADFCLVATAESLTENVPLDPDKHANVIEWIKRMSELSYYDELNGAPARDFQGAVREFRAKNSETE